MLGNDWKTLRAELPEDVRSRLDQKREARRLGKALAEVRRAMNATQQDVATRAAMTQNTVSKIESADDVLLSSVVRYMHSIGGGVEIVLKMPDGKAKRVDFDPEISVKHYA